MPTQPLTNPIITQRFGENPTDYQKFGYPGHNGIDLTTSDTPPIVYAFEAGQCIKVGYEPSGYGNYLVLEHKLIRSLYAHLSQIYINEKDQVIEGAPIGIMGNTGNSTGPHLHFGILDIQQSQRDSAYHGYVDPQNYLALCGQPTPDKPTAKPTKTKPAPRTHGKRTMYPRKKNPF